MAKHRSHMKQASTRRARRKKNADTMGGSEASNSSNDGKLSPWEAEAIMSADLPSGDPELTPPASSADQSPDFQREKLDVEREDENQAA